MYDLRTKLYQMFILGLKGGGYEAALQNGLGGVIFFTDDIKSAPQFRALTAEVRRKSIIYPFLSIDQEGGRVERTQNIHGGKKYLSAKFAFEGGVLREQTLAIARELKSYGINLNFAPCIDVNTNPDNPIIGERAFSSNPDEVTECGNNVAEIYRQNGIIPCFKHYPGHGDAGADSHLTLPEIDLPLEEMERTHIKPFALLCNGAEMIMAAHLHCTCFEKESVPTSLSSKAIGYLRDKLGFDGVVISDDMIMKGVADFGAVEACVMGIKAGLNMFIYRDSEPQTVDIIERVYKIAAKDVELAQNIENSFERIVTLKKKFIFSC